MAVSRVRREAAAQLTAWGLEDVSFSAGLVLSELTTNAIRYGNAPIRVRLLLDRNLICEVSDGSSTSRTCGTPPRPTRAAAGCSSSRSTPNGGGRATRTAAR